MKFGRRSQHAKRRQPQSGVNGWRKYASHVAADNAARTYIARCRDGFKPDGFRVLSQRDDGRTAHYPVLIISDPVARSMHSRSGFRIVGS